MNKYAVTEELLLYKDKHPEHDIINCWWEIYHDKISKLPDDDVIMLVETLLIFYNDLGIEDKVIFRTLIEDFKKEKIGKKSLFNNMYFVLNV